MRYDQQFNVTLTATLNGVTAAQIEKVSLIRPASVTHWFDSDQRFVKLTSSVSGTWTLNVTAPADGNEAAPGYHMLFVVSELGAPSVAAWGPCGRGISSGIGLIDALVEMGYANVPGHTAWSTAAPTEEAFAAGQQLLELLGEYPGATLPKPWH